MALFMLIVSELMALSVFAGDQGQSPEQLYNEANSAYDRGDMSRAISLYKQVISLQPDSVPARTNLAVALAHEGRYQEAIVQYQDALKRDPKNSMIRLNLALAWYKQAQFEKAAAELESLRREHTDSQQSLYLLADCYLRLGRNSDAATLLEPAYRANPEDRAVDYALGTALIREGHVQKGEAVIDHILKDGNTAEADLLMGEAQFAAGNYQTAAATLQKGLALNPDVPTGWSLYGRCLLNTDDHPGAKTAFQRALKGDPNDFAANLYLGAVLRVGGNNEEAAPYLLKALRLRPASPEAGFQIGALDAATGKLEQARNQFEQLERDWPDFLEVHVQLASVYSRLKLKEESQREQEIVLELNEKARAKKSQP
jgi:tetratricopeptide (TPR) repeat protein